MGDGRIHQPSFYLFKTMTYSEKLRRPEWQRKRLQILERDGWACVCCRSKEKNLQVHHVVYAKSKDPWTYPDYLYQTLCEDCHPVRQELVDNLVTALRISLMREPTSALRGMSRKAMADAMQELPDATEIFHEV